MNAPLDRSLAADLAQKIARIALEHHLIIGAAESLTGGAISQELAKAPDASEWFAGAVTAYRSETKFRVLGVAEGPVITAECAIAMASGACALLGADIAVSVTGAGGPGEEEGRPAGTVYIGIASPGRAEAFEHHFDGSPEDVVDATVTAALRHLLAEAAGALPGGDTSTPPSRA